MDDDDNPFLTISDEQAPIWEEFGLETDMNAALTAGARRRSSRRRATAAVQSSGGRRHHWGGGVRSLHGRPLQRHRSSRKPTRIAGHAECLLSGKCAVRPKQDRPAQALVPPGDEGPHCAFTALDADIVVGSILAGHALQTVAKTFDPPLLGRSRGCCKVSY